MKIVIASALMLLGVFASGCSSIGSMDRSVITMPAAPVAASAPSADAPAVVIRSVTDARVFEAAPRNPSTPSLGPDGGGADVQARAVARKRHGYGGAVGDVLLAPGETVESLTRRHVVAAFQQAGVRVIEGSAASPETPRVDVRIDQFWAWLHPAFMIHHTTHIQTTLSVAGAEPVVVTGHFEREGPLPPDHVFIEAYQQALTAYRNDLAARARAAPFVSVTPTS